MSDTHYESFVRSRISELRLQKNVSEHKMSLELGRSGSYIRGITSGIALPSLKELFNIMTYLDVTPPEFFAPLEKDDTTYHRICRHLQNFNEEELKKVEIFLEWINR